MGDFAYSRISSINEPVDEIPEQHISGPQSAPSSPHLAKMRPRAHSADQLFYDVDNESDSKVLFQSMENNALKKAKEEPKVSNFKVVLLILKSMLGSGLMFLPKAFYNGGILFSSVVLVFFGLLATTCMLLLLQCQRKCGEKGSTFQEIAFQAYGKHAASSVKFSLVVSQLGFCTVYFIFVAQNTLDVLQVISGCGLQDLDTTYIILAQIAVYTPLALIRRLDKLSITSLVANVVIGGTLIYMISYDIHSIATDGAEDIKSFNSSQFVVSLGTFVYTFEGIGLVLPINRAARDKKRFPKVLTITMIGLITLFVIFGSLGYAVYGENTEDLILINLKQGTIEEIIQICFSFVIIFTWPLMFYPAINILEARVFKRQIKSFKLTMKKNLFRTAIVVTLAGLGIIGGSNFDHFVSLIGSLCCVPLAFIYPALFHFKLCSDNGPKFLRYLDYSILTFGVGMMIWGTFQTIYSWATTSPSDPEYHCDSD